MGLARKLQGWDELRIPILWIKVTGNNRFDSIQVYCYQTSFYWSFLWSIIWIIFMIQKYPHKKYAHRTIAHKKNQKLDPVSHENHRAFC